MRKFSEIFFILFAAQISRADISHLLIPDYAIFHQHPFHFGFQQNLQTPQQLYGPPQDTQPAAGYPNPVTPAPVAPTQSPTTEFFLPEIVENRSVKDQINFIPLQNAYLPPDIDERPNYESPKPPEQSNHHDQHHHQHHHGYYYPRPTAGTTTTTTAPSSPIVVVEPIETLPPFNGYDYNAPPPPSRPPSTPAPVYLPPPAVIATNGFGFEEAGVVRNVDAANPLRLRIKEMRCMQPSVGGGGYFRAALKIDSFLTATPTVDNDSNEKRCELRLARGSLLIDIAGEDFAKCGVRLCGKDLCLRLRFPVIRGMRTGNDAMLTLHCKSQERIAVKVHALKVNVANDVQARSIGTYAQGGSQNAFRTQIELLRRSRNGNGFTRQLETHGAVQLGEDLLLRAHVLPGDGWNFTKLSDVNLQRISPSGELLNTAQLVTTRGCLNPSMSSICNQPPIYDPPLGNRLNFKAVMFQGMHSGDELVMSMRITACLEQHDCHVNQQECSNNQFGSIGRRRRDTELDEENQRTKQAEISEITRISFRVIVDNFEMEKLAKEIRKSDGDEQLITLQPRVLILLSSFGFALILTCLGVIAAWKLNKI